MMDTIKKILNNTNIEEIISNIERLLGELSTGKVKQEDIVKKAKSDLKSLRSKNKAIINNVQIYEKENAIKAFLAEEIVNGTERYPIEDVLQTICNELKRFNKDEEKKQIVSKKTIEQLLQELEEEFKFITIIKNEEINLSFMIFDIPHQGDCNFIKYNILEERNCAIHKYPMKSTDVFANIFMIMKQIGLFLCYILDGEAKTIPDDFRECTNQMKHKILEEQYESNKNTQIFAEAFAAIFFRKRNIRKNIETNESEDANILLEYFDRKLEELYEQSKQEQEWHDNELCPCRSGKKYKDCCKKKDLKYYYKDENTYTKSMKMGDEVKDILFMTSIQFKELFGRAPGKKDFVVSGILNNQLDREVRKLKLEGKIPSDYLYAYDRTGIMLSQYNYTQFSDKDIQEFNEARQEYRDLITEDIKDNRGNLLQVVEMTNLYLKELFEKNINSMQYVLNKYIKDLTQKIGIPEEFYIKTMEDLMVYSAYRTNTHLETLQELVEEGYYENSLAVVRMLFEILINVKVFRKDRKLFNEKILSLVAEQEGKYIKKSKFVMQDPKTGKEYYCKIKMDKFAEMAGEKYTLLYETLYDELSGFIHLDTLTAKRIFEKKDNFLDLDESYIAGIMAMVFALEIVLELNQFEDNKEQTKNDLRYYCNSRIDKLIEALKMIKIIDEKKTYQILVDTLEEYKEDDYINQERDSRNK